MAGGVPIPPAILRFDLTERVVHWVNAVMFLILVFTGATLYLSPLQSLIGRRALIEDIHIYTGIALPFPLAVSLCGRWGRALRADLGRLNRWTKADRVWLRSRGRGPGLELGKFNAGQKLNAAFIAGAGLVMLGTGLIMKWYHPWPLSWRTGATFVHDWLSIAVGVVIAGHIGMALRDPDALRSMVVGTVSRRWAASRAPGWIKETD
jgi:formate dehydrogenase subunit gamma